MHFIVAACSLQLYYKINKSGLQPVSRPVEQIILRKTLYYYYYYYYYGGISAAQFLPLRACLMPLIFWHYYFSAEIKPLVFSAQIQLFSQP